MIDTLYPGKRDLHIGGTVPRPAAAAGGVADGSSTNVRNALLSAGDFVRSNPWQSLTVVAVLGLAAGYGLAAAFSSRR